MTCPHCQPVSDKRSDEQNRKMWAALGDISRQVLWPVDGELKKLSAEDWKHVLSAGLKRHQRVAKGIDGGFVILGQSTSRLKVKEMADLITLIDAFGAEHQVSWSDPNWISMQREYENSRPSNRPMRELLREAKAR